MGTIQESTSPWASRFFLVPQPGREDREVVDYRALNGITKPDLYPLPRIDDTLAMMQGLKYVSTFDGSKGFWQILMSLASRQKTAFITHRGLYEFLCMPFGLKNAPGVFQRMMDSTFAGLKWLICLVYLDDIIVWARSWEEHLERVEKVLQRCRERNLGLKATKSYVGFSELRILGHTVNSDGRFPDAKKVVGIAAIADPKNKAELATFLGMTGFYSEYIKDYASIAAPLNELRKASSTWQWTQECSNAVKRLKDELVSPTVLAHPDYEKEFYVMPDASIFAVGGVLCQLDDKGKERPVSFRSKKLKPAEQKYAVYELEALAVVYCVRKFRPYIEGSHFFCSQITTPWFGSSANQIFVESLPAGPSSCSSSTSPSDTARARFTSFPTRFLDFRASTKMNMTTSKTSWLTRSATRPRRWLRRRVLRLLQWLPTTSSRGRSGRTSPTSVALLIFIHLMEKSPPWSWSPLLWSPTRSRWTLWLLWFVKKPFALLSTRTPSLRLRSV